MTTLRQWFDRFESETGERPELITLAWGYRPTEGWPDLPEGLVRFDELDPAVLDHEFNDSWGRTESPDLCAWSPNFVVISEQYDGSEEILWVPRHPIVHKPARPGG